jgi:hypothetical protein
MFSFSFGPFVFLSFLTDPEEPTADKETLQKTTECPMPAYDWQ